MFSRIGKHVTYANVAMTLALVFAMSGGAYAASKYVISSTKQISPKVLKSLQGKNGTNGTNGATGAAGPQGPAGAAGAKGENGAAGNNGVNGATGPAGPAGPKGAAGATGATGSPWTAGGTLPTGASEKGMVAATNVGVNAAATGQGNGTISFGIPLASAPTANYIGPGATHTTGTGELTSGSAIVKNLTTSAGQFALGEVISGSGIPASTTIKKLTSSTELELSAEATTSGTGVSLTADLPAACQGSYADPTATSGNLCVYANQELLGVVAFEQINAVSAVGAIVHTEEGLSGETLIDSWAVTG